MRSKLAVILLGILAGVALGVCEASLWLRFLVGDYSPYLQLHSFLRLAIYPAVVTLAFLVLLVCYFVLQHIKHDLNAIHTMLISFSAMSLGTLFYILFMWMFRPFCFGSWINVLLLSAGTSISLAMISWLVQPRTPKRFSTATKLGLLVFVLSTASALSLRVAASPDTLPELLGASVFTAVLAQTVHRSEPAIPGSIIAGAALGLYMAVAWSRINGCSILKTAMLGVVAGALAAGCICTSHLMQLAQIVGSAYDEPTAMLSALFNCSVIGLIFSSAFLFYNISRRSIASLTIPIVYLVFGAIYLSNVHSGRELYLAAQRTHGYQTYVYLHYSTYGGWQRTSDTRSDDTKLLKYNKLIHRHPGSLYRPEAMLESATALFYSWRFADAASMLQQYHRDYPGRHGESTMLLYLSLLADGRPADAAHLAQTKDGFFQHWLSHDGSRLAAIAYADIGLRSRATGLYSHYLDHLLSEYEGKWVTAAAENVENSISELQSQIDTGKPEVASLSGVVQAPFDTSSVRVAFVRPQLDACSLEDSRQFTGPKSIPLWNGRTSFCGRDGQFIIHNVPYGNYEPVIGFDASKAPDGFVIAPVEGSVVVHSGEVRIPPVRFVPSVKQISPANGGQVTSRPTLSWKPYSGAANYSVSVIASSAVQGNYSSLSSAYTCWSKSGIEGTNITIDDQGFDIDQASDEFSQRSLIPGRVYLWVVYACDSAGRVISSSEHYRQTTETSFGVSSKHFNTKSADTKGGELPPL